MKRTPHRKGKCSHAKTILRLPDLNIAKAAVINSLSCPDAQRYRDGSNVPALPEQVDDCLLAAVFRRAKSALRSLQSAGLGLPTIKRLDGRGGHSSRKTLPKYEQRGSASIGSRHMTCAGRALVCAAPPGPSWSRFNSSWGNISVQTTERSPGCTQRIASAVNDRIGIEPAR